MEAYSLSKILSLTTHNSVSFYPVTLMLHYETVLCQECKVTKFQGGVYLIHNLSYGSIDWQMVFNLDKCEHLQVSLKKHPLTSQYTLSDSQIKHVPSIKHLGVIINNNLLGLIMLLTLPTKQIMLELSCKEI